MGLLNKIKKGVIEGAATVLSTPARVRGNRVMRQADIDTAALKADRLSGGVPIEPDPSNPASRTRWLADDARYRRDPAFKAKIDARVKQMKGL